MENNTTKRQPRGYWTKQTCYQEALNHKSRIEFKKGCRSAYEVARKNSWLDNYTWFTEKKKCNYWTYETCYQEALNYKSRIEFAKGCGSAYYVARKNGWLDKYNWFISINELKKIKQTKWTKQTCYQEALNYKSRSEFQKGCSGAYQVACKKGWIDNYTWFISTNELLKLKLTKWTKQTCYQEAKKYNSRREFEKGCRSAYQVARQNGWLDNYTWFTEKKKCNYWTYETCYQEALNYKSRIEFAKGCGSAYEVARKNGWLDKYTWLKRSLDIYINKLDNVYCYLFTNQNSIYIGRTININRRNRDHNTDKKSTVYKFAKQNNIVIPQITILEANLNPIEGLEKEHFYVNKYKQEGWNVLNIAKTGKNSGSLGTINHTKWTEKKCLEEALKYKSKKEFRETCRGAYIKAMKKRWLDNYTWLSEKYKPISYWNEQTCYQEALNYKSRIEFKKGCKGGYKVALKNGWLDNYTWFEEKQKPNGYWTYETCYQEALNYKSRKEFEKGCRSAYQVAWKNGWLDNYTWFSISKTAKKWTYETCYQEALKYNSRSKFQKGCKGAYKVALKNGWLDIFFPIGK